MAEKKRAAAYVCEDIGISRKRPQLEALIRKASKKPKPFDAVFIYNSSVLGTPEEAEDAVSRLSELGIEVKFVT
jgi:hypothetical protein